MIRVVVVLSVLACLTVRQLPTWSSDAALWSAAVQWNTTAPRPAYNLGVALRKQGRPIEAVRWLTLAVERASGTPKAAEYLRAVQAQFFAMEITGFYPCDLPSARRYC